MSLLARHAFRSKHRACFVGDPLESDRLRPLFLRWIGNRSNKSAFIAAGIDPDHGARWLSGGCLRDADQVTARILLSNSGIAPSPAG